MKALSYLTYKTMTKAQLELEASKWLAAGAGKSLNWQKNQDYRDTHKSGVSMDEDQYEELDPWDPVSTNAHIDWLMLTGQPIGEIDGESEDDNCLCGKDYEELRDLFTNAERKYLSRLRSSSRQVLQEYGNSAGKYSRQRERQIIQMMIKKVEKAKSYCKNHHQLLKVSIEYLAKYDVRPDLEEVTKLDAPAEETTQGKLK